MIFTLDFNRIDDDMEVKYEVLIASIISLTDQIDILKAQENCKNIVLELRELFNSESIIDTL
jgi:hypothetical protein